MHTKLTNGTVTMARYPDIKAQHDIVVETDRLTLRPVAIKDLSALHRMRMNAMVMEFM